MLPPSVTDDQAVAILEGQIAAIQTRLEAGEQIVARSETGIDILQKAPAATLANIGEVVGALREGLLALLESNLMANKLSLAELQSQQKQLETVKLQRSSKVHLGGFVPATHRR